jgi:hypothetical protein
MQTPEQKANVPKTPDASKRWLEGLQALAELHDKAARRPEDDGAIHHDLAYQGEVRVHAPRAERVWR